MIPACLVPLRVNSHAAIQNKELFVAGMHMPGKQGAGLKLEEDCSAAGLRVEPKKPSMDARPFGLLPSAQIAVDREFACHEFHPLMR